MATQNILELDGKRGMDKQKALESALGQIERQFGKGSIMRLGKDSPVEEIEATSTGSLGLDLALGIKVIDRTELILQIFARRASSAEAQAQVALAQLEYLVKRIPISHRQQRFQGGNHFIPAGKITAAGISPKLPPPAEPQHNDRGQNAEDNLR